MLGLQIWEKLNEKIVLSLLNLLETKERDDITREKVRYTLTVLLSEFEKVLGLFIIFNLLGSVYEFWVAFLSLVMLRSFTGGSHRKTMLGCFLQSLFNFSVILYIGKNLMFGNLFCIVMYIFFIIMICLYIPLNSKNRIQYTRKQRYCFKIKALVVITIFLLLNQIIHRKYFNIILSSMNFQLFEIVKICILERRKIMMKEELKQKINDKLSKMASTILMESSSFLVWGEVELPECLRNELEKSSMDDR